MALIIERTPLKLDNETYIGKAVRGEFEAFDQDVVFTVDGRPVLAYGDWAHEKDRELLRWCEGVNFPTMRRLAYTGRGERWELPRKGKGNWPQTEELYFGYRPMRAVYNFPTGPTRYTLQYPMFYDDVILALARRLDEVFKTHFGTVYRDQRKILTDAINADWRMGGDTLWTQMVINKLNQFPFHMDRNNYKGSINSMICYNYGHVGGHTVVPAFNAKFIMRGAKYLIFPAQDWVHGVTPFKPVRPRAYRYSLVFYAHEAMAKVGTLAEEEQRFKNAVNKRFDPDMAEKRRNAIQKVRHRQRKGTHYEV